VSGLTNPTSADHLAAEAGSFEPQRQNNFTFEVALGDADRDLIEMGLNALPLPNEANEIVELLFQNEKRKVAGQSTVDDVTLTIVDFVDKDTRGAIMRWRKMVYDPQTGKIGLAKDYKKTAYIVLHGPDESNVRVCKLKGTWPSAVNGGSLSMEGSDKVLIEVTLTIDKADWSESITGA